MVTIFWLGPQWSLHAPVTAFMDEFPRRDEGSGMYFSNGRTVLHFEKYVARVNPVQLIRATRDLNQGPTGSTVQSSNHYNTAAC